jgi:predicted peptidase
MLKKALLYFVISLIPLMVLAYFNRNKIRNIRYVSFFTSETYSNEKFKRNLNYRLFTPKKSSLEKYPLLLYLHPYGDNGTDNKKQISNLVYEWAKNKNQSEFPCYIFAPQCTAGMEWVDKGSMGTPFKHYSQDSSPERDEMKMIVEVINQMHHTLPIDSSRIYVIGHSMGATGCWDMLTRYPDIFAASIISSGVSDTSKAFKLTNIPLWAFSGEYDNIAPANLNKTMVESINQRGGDSKFTLFKGEGHNIGLATFNYPGVKEWLFSQRKSF